MIDIVARKKAPRNPKAAEKYFDAAQAATRAVQSQWLPTTLGVASNLAKTTTRKAEKDVACDTWSSDTLWGIGQNRRKAWMVGNPSCMVRRRFASEE